MYKEKCSIKFLSNQKFPQALTQKNALHNPQTLWNSWSQPHQKCVAALGSHCESGTVCPTNKYNKSLEGKFDQQQMALRLGQNGWRSCEEHMYLALESLIKKHTSTGAERVTWGNWWMKCFDAENIKFGTNHVTFRTAFNPLKNSEKARGRLSTLRSFRFRIRFLRGGCDFPKTAKPLGTIFGGAQKQQD